MSVTTNDKKLPLTKDEFVEFMQRFEELHKRDLEITVFFQDKLNCLPETPYDYMETLYLDTLEKLMGDTESWIGYFVFELEFGASCTADSVRDKDGKSIPLYNASDLYDLLVGDIE